MESFAARRNLQLKAKGYNDNAIFDFVHHVHLLCLGKLLVPRLQEENIVQLLLNS